MERFPVFFLSLSSTVLEAVPFLLAGSLLGVLLEKFLPEKVFRMGVFRHAWLGPIASVGLGFLLPTCECGVLPVVKKLVKKGMPPHLAVVYMFASPALNPVVLLSTYVAFRSSWKMTAARAGVAVLVALVAGWVLSREKTGLLLKDPPAEPHESGCTGGARSGCEDHGHHSAHGEGGNGSGGGLSRLAGSLRHASAEFLEMTKFLVVGAVVAAAFRAFVPREAIWWFEPNMPVSILFLMVLAVLLCVCSEADAFVAATFHGMNPVAQLAFVAIGPVVDLKLILMNRTFFSRRAMVWMIVIPFAVTYCATAVMGLVMQGGRP